MDSGTFDAELLYGASLSVADTLLRRGLLTDEEHSRIKAGLLERYRPVFAPLFPEKGLINPP